MDWNMPPHRPKGPKEFQEFEQFLRQLKSRLGFGFSPQAGSIVVWWFWFICGANSYYRVDPEETAGGPALRSCRADRGPWSPLQDSPLVSKRCGR